MKKMLLVVIVVALASFASAQSTNAMGRRSVKSDTPLTLVHHVLKTMSNTNGSSFSAGVGFTAVDSPNTVVCPGTAGSCLIQAHQIVQLGNPGDGQTPPYFYVTA